MNKKSLSYIFEERMYHNEISVSPHRTNHILNILGNPAFVLAKDYHLDFEILFRIKYSKEITNTWIKEYCEVIGVPFPNYLKPNHWHKHIFKKGSFKDQLKVYQHKIGNRKNDFNLLIENTINDMIEIQSNLLENNNYSKYRKNCLFFLSMKDLSKIDGYSLLTKYRWYSKNNILGMTKDHKFSVNEGFQKGVPTYIISHPANCEFMPLRKNSSKNDSSSITLRELENRIKNWNIQ